MPQQQSEQKLLLTNQLERQFNQIQEQLVIELQQQRLKPNLETTAKPEVATKPETATTSEVAANAGVAAPTTEKSKELSESRN